MALKQKDLEHLSDEQIRIIFLTNQTQYNTLIHPVREYVLIDNNITNQTQRLMAVKAILKSIIVNRFMNI